METNKGISRQVLLRDLLIFQLKLLLDGVKDIVLVQLSLGAAVIDLVFGGGRRGRLFYAVVRLSERFDLWLNLHNAAQGAEENQGGLVGASPRGVDGLISRVESLVRLLASVVHQKWAVRRHGPTADASPAGAPPRS